MPDPIAPEGVLPNLLRWIDRPGQVVRNVLRGEGASASRQLGDFLGEAIDAAIPGDVIPAATRPEDYVSGSELVGIDKDASAWARVPTDIGIGLLTDPLTYLTFGATAIPKGASAIEKATHAVKLGIPFTDKAIDIASFGKPVDPLSLASRAADTGIKAGLGKLDKLSQSATAAGKQASPLTEGYEAAKSWVRRAAGAEKMSARAERALQESSATGSAASKLYQTQALALLKGVPQDERVLLGQAYEGIDIGSLIPSRKGNAVPMEGDLDQRIEQLAVRYGKDAAKLKQIAAGINDLGKRQWEEGLEKRAFFNPVAAYRLPDNLHEEFTPDQLRKMFEERRVPGETYDDFLQAEGALPIYRDAGRKDYLQRQWLLHNEDILGQHLPASGKSQALKGEVLDTPEKRAAFFNSGDVGIELDPAKSLLERAHQQGQMLERAQLAHKFMGKGTLAGKGDENLINNALKNIEDEYAAGRLTRDDVGRLHTALKGMAPREGMFKFLAEVNRHIKGPMVYGVVLPKIGSIIRNRLSMPIQAAATPGAESAAAALANPVKIANDILRAGDEAFGQVFHGSKTFARSDELGRDMSLIDEAFRSAKKTDDVGAYLKNAGREDLADAVRHGVLDGFVSTEELVKAIARTPNMQKWMDIVNAPAIMFQAIEQRGRLATFKSLRPKMGGAEAAQKTKDALFDYGVSSEANRSVRAVIPFAQFAMKAIPQSAKWMSRQPAAGVAAAPLFYDASGDQGPIYPYMQSQSRINIGRDEQNNPLYLSGFGLPMEALNLLPQVSGSPTELGRSVARGVVASSHPFLKTAETIVSGVDPFFNTPAMSYSKLPIVGEAGEVGRYVNLAAGAGLLEPLGYGGLRQIGQAVDSTKPAGARAVDLLSGAKLISVDEDRAKQMIIQNYLKTRPDIKQATTFYRNEPDEEFQGLMAELRAAKARSKAKKEAAAAAQ